jgi:hypothetical protein
MENDRKTAVVVAVIGATATIFAAIIGAKWGKENVEVTVSVNGESVILKDADIKEIAKENEDLKNQLSLVNDDLSSTQSELSETKKTLSTKEEELQNKLSEAPKVEYSDFDININGEVTENLKKAFLNIDGRDFISFDILNKITNEEINYSDNVLYIGHTTGKKVNLMNVCPPYDVSYGDYYSDDSFEMTGKTYDGFSMVSYGTQYVLVNIEGKYSNLIFDFGHIDGEDKCNCTLNIYLDDKLEKTIEQRADANVSHINIPLNYSNHLKIEFYSDYRTRYGLGNIKLKY